VRFISAIFIALLLAGTVIAIHDFQVYDTNIDSYSGQIARDRRIYDPYTRDRYFGQGYERQFVNFGSKGPTDRFRLSGSKSSFSGSFNLDTNSLSNQGRDPAHISNWDPKVRGYARLDRAIELLPYNPANQLIGVEPSMAKGTARILSTGDQYGAGNNQPHPSTQIFMQAINVPPINEDQVYEAWLYDDESEYALSLGIMRKGSIPLTLQFVFDYPRLVHMFDEVWITKESFPSEDPSPHEIILSGRINPARTELNTPPNYYSRLR
jgi:hypothetical protein